MSKNQKQGPDSPTRSKMLKKAFSFRDDFRGFIALKRSPSTSTSSSDPVKRSPSPSKRNSSRPTSSSSIGETSTKIEKTVSNSTEKTVDKLQRESRKVFQALKYVHDVVDKNMLQMLPGSASIVLETVMEMNTLLSNHFINQQSSVLTSTFNKLYQSLANLIKWADCILIQGAETLDPNGAHEIISAVDEGMNEILKLAVDKLQNKGYLTLPRSPARTLSVKSTASASGQDSPQQRTSLPDIPLTPREKEILQQTSLNSVERLSTENVFDNNNSVITDEAPPKPPLPSDGKSPLLSRRIENTSQVSDSSDEPPPIPEKRRSANDPSTGSSLPSSANQSPHHKARCVLINQPVGDSLMFSQFSPLPTLDSSLLSLSPSSSNTSAVNTDTGDSSVITVTKKTRYDLSPGYDNLNFDINDLTLQISQLTSNMEGGPPPLPQKQRDRLSSDYDNVTEVKEKQVIQISNKGQRSMQVKTLGTTGESTVIGFQESSSMHKSSSFSKITEFKQGSSTNMQYQQMASSSRQFQQLSNVSGPNMPFASSGSFQVPNGNYQNTTSSPSGMQFTSAGGNKQFGNISGTGPNNNQFQGNFGHAMQFKQNATVQQLGLNTQMSQESFSSSETFSSMSTTSMDSLQKPPPLPPKKRHVEAYMGMFGQYSHPSLPDFSRHSIHSVNFHHEQWYQHQLEFFHPRSHTISIMSDLSSDNSDVFSISPGEGFIGSSGVAPVLPPKKKLAIKDSPQSTSSSLDTISDDTTERSRSMMIPQSVHATKDQAEPLMRHSLPATVADKKKRQKPPAIPVENDLDSDFSELNTLDDIDVSDQLVKKKGGEDGPEIRGGAVDALVVHATHVSKHDFLYQEAFLTTYRTFIKPEELIKKLLYRHQKFAHMNEDAKKRLSRNAFSLLIRVVDELCGTVEDKVLETLMMQVFELLCDGELMLARILRKKILEKCESKSVPPDTSYHMSHSLTAKPMSLTDFKSLDIAEQMTLLDAELFHKIEIPEVLIWSKEQKEELSPNLTKFTEHFNKMSYWCRTRILEHDDAKERERYLMKFIKIMKHLRKLNNFNSYLAILSAVDSAPIRRLEWQKQNLEVLKEFCELIDSSSSFRAYRQALAETEQPCIPYIGLILQDLTFVHIGNQDCLSDGNVNFAKRWQQFNILECMRRFKKCDYRFKKNLKIVSFFSDFDDYLCEETLWQISESIKPRGGRKKVE